MNHIKDIIDLAYKASQGSFDIEKGSIGFNGYGFVFKDIFKERNQSFITGKYSSLVCTIMEFKKINYLIIPGLHYIGRIKTLLPALELGGYYHLFSCWILVMTPEKKVFPIVFYYGKRGFSLGGWNDFLFEKLLKENENNKKELAKFKHFMNSNLFDLDQKEQQDLVENLLKSLHSVLVSDFYGIIERDSHKTLLAYFGGNNIVRTYQSDVPNTRIFDKIKEL